MSQYLRAPASAGEILYNRNDKNDERESDSAVEEGFCESIASIHRNILSRLFQGTHNSAGCSDILENTNHSGEVKTGGNSNSTKFRSSKYVTENLRNKLHKLQRRKAYLVSELAMTRQPTKPALHNKRNLIQDYNGSFISQKKQRPYFHPYEYPRSGLISLWNNNHNNNYSSGIITNNYYSRKEVEGNGGLASFWANLRTIRRLEASHHLAGVSVVLPTTRPSDSSLISIQIDIGLFGRYVGQYHVHFHLVQLSIPNSLSTFPHNNNNNHNNLNNLNNLNDGNGKDDVKDQPLSLYLRLERHTLPLSASAIPFILQRNFGPHGMLKWKNSNYEEQKIAMLKRVNRCIGDFYDASYAHAMRRDFCHFLEQWPTATASSPPFSSNNVHTSSQKIADYNCQNDNLIIDWRHNIRNLSHPLHQTSFQNISYNDAYDRITFEFIIHVGSTSSVTENITSICNYHSRRTLDEAEDCEHNNIGGSNVGAKTITTTTGIATSKRKYLIQLIYNDPMIAKVTSSQIKDMSSIHNGIEDKKGKQLKHRSSSAKSLDKKDQESPSKKKSSKTIPKPTKHHMIVDEFSNNSNIHTAQKILVQYSLPQGLEKIINILR